MCRLCPFVEQSGRRAQLALPTGGTANVGSGRDSHADEVIRANLGDGRLAR